MAIRTYRPYTKSRRAMTNSTFEDITKSTPEKSLLAKVKKTGGRNNQGKITCRHIGGGNKRRYRIIDFRRRKDDIPATFYKHYPAFAAGTLNVSELARVCGLSIMSSKHVLSHCLQIRPLIEYIQEHQISRKTLPTSGGLPLSHQSQILIHRGPTQSAYPRQFRHIHLPRSKSRIMLIEDGGNIVLCSGPSADLLAFALGIRHS